MPGPSSLRWTLLKTDGRTALYMGCLLFRLILLGFLKLYSSRLPKKEGPKGTHSGLGGRARDRCRRDVTTIATVVLLNIDDPTWGAWAWWWGQTERATRASMFLTDVANHLPPRAVASWKLVETSSRSGAAFFGNPPLKSLP